MTTNAATDNDHANRMPFRAYGLGWTIWQRRNIRQEIFGSGDRKYLAVLECFRSPRNDPSPNSTKSRRHRKAPDVHITSAHPATFRVRSTQGADRFRTLLTS